MRSAQRYASQPRHCQHGFECWRVTCENGRYTWKLLVGFAVGVSAYTWVGLHVGFVQGG